MGNLERRTWLKALLTTLLVAGILFFACLIYLFGNEGLDRQDLAWVYLEPVCITITVLSTIAIAAAWLMTCVDAFLQKQWIWGIAILVFSWIPVLIYLVVELRRLPPAIKPDPGARMKRRAGVRRDDRVPRGPRDV